MIPAGMRGNSAKGQYENAPKSVFRQIARGLKSYLFEFQFWLSSIAFGNLTISFCARL
jgi:hypothetical protein